MVGIRPHPLGEKHLQAGARPMAEPTYEKMHELVGTLPFSWDEILEIDFENLPEHLQYTSTINLEAKEQKRTPTITVKIRDLDTEFSRNLVKFFESEPYNFRKSDFSLFYKPQGSTTPLHSDHHNRLRHLWNMEHIVPSRDHDIFKRYWIPLKDWSAGQYFELNGIPLTNWKAGDIYKLKPWLPHLAADLGHDPGLRLVITGIE